MSSILCSITSKITELVSLFGFVSFLSAIISKATTTNSILSTLVLGHFSLLASAVTYTIPRLKSAMGTLYLMLWPSRWSNQFPSSHTITVSLTFQKPQHILLDQLSFSFFFCIPSPTVSSYISIILLLSSHLIFLSTFSAWKMHFLHLFPWSIQTIMLTFLSSIKIILKIALIRFMIQIVLYSLVKWWKWICGSFSLFYI